jgi:RNA polymerase sigma-70 factor (ECF subfamily)
MAAVSQAHRHEWAYVFSSTLRVTRDFDVAEECVQDAYAKALTSWEDRGIPTNHGAWLTTVARRRALDLIRREDLWRRAQPLLVTGDADAATDQAQDDILRLVFTCCHPSLSADAQVALALRFVCGLSTADVARALLVREPTMAARITRAKKKIAAARIPYRVPPDGELPERVDAVLTVLHLVYTTGHTAPSGDHLMREELAERALDLARMLHRLLPNDAEVTSLLALLLLSDARRASRVDENGSLVTLADQDRSRWHRDSIREGLDLVGGSIRSTRPGRFALMAAIAAVHACAPSWNETDWQEIVGLYDLLIGTWPSPVVALNRAVALSFSAGPAVALEVLDSLGADPLLSSYPYVASTRADCLRRLGRYEEARAAYEEALMFTDNDVERRFLEGRIEELR